MDPSPKQKKIPVLYVGHIVRVEWSNGAGFSEYRVVDNPGSGPHLLEVIREEEYV